MATYDWTAEITTDALARLLDAWDPALFATFGGCLFDWERLGRPGTAEIGVVGAPDAVFLVKNLLDSPFGEPAERVAAIT